MVSIKMCFRHLRVAIKNDKSNPARVFMRHFTQARPCCQKQKKQKADFVKHWNKVNKRLYGASVDLDTTPPAGHQNNDLNISSEQGDFEGIRTDNLGRPVVKEVYNNNKNKGKPTRRFKTCSDEVYSWRRENEIFGNELTMSRDHYSIRYDQKIQGGQFEEFQKPSVPKLKAELPTYDEDTQWNCVNYHIYGPETEQKATVSKANQGRNVREKSATKTRDGHVYSNAQEFVKTASDNINSTGKSWVENSSEQQRDVLVDKTDVIEESAETTNRQEKSYDRYVENEEEQSRDLQKILLFPYFPTAVTSDEALVFQKADDIVLPSAHNGFYPSVTTVLSQSMPPEQRAVLDRWQKKMVKELGEEGFQLYKQELFSTGENFHKCIERFLEGQTKSELNLKTSTESYWESIQPVLEDITGVEYLEQSVTHPHLHYKGKFDCLAKYRGQECLIEWKTSRKQKATVRDTYDYPLQVAAYSGAYNFDESVTGKVVSTLIVVAYEDGQPAHAHLLPQDMSVYFWGEWLQRLYTYWKQKL